MAPPKPCIIATNISSLPRRYKLRSFTNRAKLKISIHDNQHDLEIIFSSGKLPSPSGPPLSTSKNQIERLHLSHLQVCLFRLTKNQTDDFTCRSITHTITELATVKDHSCNAQNFFNPQPQEKSCYICSHTTSPHIL